MRNKYIGKYTETVFEVIEDDFTYSNLFQFLNEIIEDRFKYAQKDFVDWCVRGWCKYMDVDIEDKSLEKTIKIFADVDCQWDLYLANTYSLSELQNMNYYEVKLPKEFYENWKNEL